LYGRRHGQSSCQGGWWPRDVLLRARACADGPCACVGLPRGRWHAGSSAARDARACITVLAGGWRTVRRAGEARQPSKDRAARLGCACKVGRISPEEHIVKELEVFPSICVHLKLCSSRQRIRRKRTSCRGPGERGAPWMQPAGAGRIEGVATKPHFAMLFRRTGPCINPHRERFVRLN